MTPLLGEILAYSVQLAVLVTAVAILLRILRLTDPAAEHLLWRAAFAAAWLLPFAAWWVAPPPSDLLFRLQAEANDAGAGPGLPLRWAPLLAIVLALGVSARLIRLGLGAWRISAWQHAAQPREELGPDVRVSASVDGPVTVGLIRPTVLVPPRFLELSAGVRNAVLAHERLHIVRRDPLRTLVAEIWCACLWFHPAARLLTDRLELSREMCLDRKTVAITGDRRAYAEALLVFGGASPSAGIPAFIRRGQLSRRVAALTGEVKPMTRTRRSLIVTTVALIVTAATVTAARFAPMYGVAALATRVGQDAYRAGDGISLPVVVHEVKAQYTPEALAAKIQGDVLMSVVVLTDGSVDHVSVVQSLDQVHGLDEAAVTAARQWRFEPGRKDDKPVPVQVELMMRFTLK